MTNFLELVLLLAPGIYERPPTWREVTYRKLRKTVEWIVQKPKISTLPLCWQRQREITGTLIDLLMHIAHRVGVRAEKKVDIELLK